MVDEHFPQNLQRTPPQQVTYGPRLLAKGLVLLRSKFHIVWEVGLEASRRHGMEAVGTLVVYMQTHQNGSFGWRPALQIQCSAVALDEINSDRLNILVRVRIGSTPHRNPNLHTTTIWGTQFWGVRQIRKGSQGAHGDLRFIGICLDAIVVALVLRYAICSSSRVWKVH